MEGCGTCGGEKCFAGPGDESDVCRVTEGVRVVVRVTRAVVVGGECDEVAYTCSFESVRDGSD